jgi:hypothetical protein
MMEPATEASVDSHVDSHYEIETIYDQLKNICQIEHTRHRSPINFLVHLVCGLIAYCHAPKKPTLDLDPNPDLLALPSA